MIVVNADFVKGHQLAETLGLAHCSTVRAKHLGKDFVATVRSIVGGEIKEYAEMLVESPQRKPSSNGSPRGEARRQRRD